MLSTRRVPGFKLNLAANITGAVWSGLAQLICVPLIVRFVGVQAYGLIGFYTMIQASLQILDLGVSPTINRELARESDNPGSIAGLRDLVRTLEAGYWAVGLLAALVLGALANVIADFWIGERFVNGTGTSHVIQMMATLIAIQWPASYYRSGLVGLQHQVSLNIVRVANATLTNVAAVLVVWLVSPSLIAYFTWQVLVAFANTATLGVLLWHHMPASTRKPRFELKSVRHIRRFAVGIGGVTALGLMLTQMDKVILSKLLDLQSFGYYVLAGVAVSGLQLIIGPMFNAIYPRLSALVAGRNDVEVRRRYHDATQLMAALVVPAALIVISFPREILFVWTHNTTLSERAAPIVVLLMIGTALNGIMNVPYALHLAYGWTRIAVQITATKIVVFAPLAIWAASRFGGVGAAAVWAMLNLAYLIIGPPLIHRGLHIPATARWYYRDVGIPLLCSGLAAILIRSVLLPSLASGALARQIAELACAYGIVQIAALMGVDRIRGTLLRLRPDRSP